MPPDAVGHGLVTVARGRCEGSDRLVEAEPALAALQRACGGELPGIVAVPALLELLRQAWTLRHRLARRIHAQDGENAVSAWVEVVPDARGCAVAFSEWRAVPLGEPAGELADDALLLPLLADLHVRLDARQGVVAVGHAEAPLAALAERLTHGRGEAWTAFVDLPGAAHRQPLHWRLLDRAAVEVADAPGRWEARILPAPGRGVAGGFDLYLVPAVLAALPEAPMPAAEAGAPDLLEGVLAADLAPALEQPVARIIANAETIRTRLAGPLADEYAAYAGDIADAARHLADLVSDIADLETIEAPEFKPLDDAVDLAEAARRAAGLLAMRARERGIAVEVPAANAVLPARGEWRRVLQILLNLLGNALRYAPAESTVRLTVAASGARARLTVADEGPGLSAEEGVRAFAKFERLGRSGDGGSGLGLYISRRLARAMGGDLTVASTPGAGARFTLELPGG